MTEREWLTSSDPVKMLRLVNPDRWRPGLINVQRANARQLRLFACACARQVWDRLTDNRSRSAVEVAERYADGKHSNYEVESNLLGRAKHASWVIVQWDALNAEGTIAARKAAWTCSDDAEEAARGALECPKASIAPIIQAAILRDIVGNPFRPTSLCGVTDGITRTELVRECPNCAVLLAWGSGTVPRMAQTIYDERAFERLPVLADALEEAGCDNAEIIEHLRGSGPHARGCWVLDLLLGKE